MSENVRATKAGKHCAKSIDRNDIDVKFNIIYSFVVVGLVLAVFISLGVYRWNDSVQNKAVETYKAELEAQRAEESAAKAEEMMLAAQEQKAEIEMFAKLFEGIRRFNYSNSDLMTYGWGVYNRVDSSLYPNTPYDVIHQKDQWTAFSDDNIVVSDYYRIAEKLVAERYSDSPRPCTTDFLWAELGSDGIYLKNSVEPGRIARTWHYSD